MHHLAHLNIAHMRAPLTAPLMAGFAAQLDVINALADRSPGFVWRLTDEDPNDPAILALGESMLINLSVWQGLESLEDFVYRSAHRAVMQRRRDWFTHMPEPFVVLWWVPVTTLPTVADAVARLRQLQRQGASPDAFTFRTPFSAPGSGAPSA